MIALELGGPWGLFISETCTPCSMEWPARRWFREASSGEQERWACTAASIKQCHWYQDLGASPGFYLRHEPKKYCEGNGEEKWGRKGRSIKVCHCGVYCSRQTGLLLAEDPLRAVDHSLKLFHSM